MIISTTFWLTLALLTYLYAGYPFSLALMSHFRTKMSHQQLAIELPSITLFIPAYNEADVIADKIENALALDYPRHLLEIVVASDGSTDQTADIIRSFENLGAIPLISDENIGKNALINSFIPETRGEIIVFTDANAMFKADSLRRLAVPFNNPKVGCVGGRLRYLKGHSPVARGEGLYFKYENILRKMEGLIGCAVGANGAIYAIRRHLFEPVPGHVPNDFFHPLTTLRKGYHSTFVEDAVAFEKPTENQEQEFSRRKRIVARSIAALPAALRMPGSFPLGAWFCLASHKILRWLTLPIMVVNLTANILLADQPIFIGLLAIQFGFYFCGLLGYWGERVGVRLKMLYVPYYFFLINMACVYGVMHWIAGKRFVRWKPASSTR